MKRTAIPLPPSLLLAVVVAALTLATSNAIPRSVVRSVRKSVLPRNYERLPYASVILITRGGSDEEDEEDDEEEFDDDEDIDEDDDDDEALFADFDMDGDAEDDFGEADYVHRVIQAYHRTAPLTKGFLTASFVATVLGYITNKNEFPPILLLDWKKVVKRGQFWRPFTTFLNVGPFGLGYLLTAQFVWNYMDTLERLHHKTPYDFWIMMIFGMLTMVVGYPVLKLNARFLGHNLSTYLVYVWSRYHEGMQVSMFDLFLTRAEMLPWFFLAQTFLLEGDIPVLDFLGIVFGHIYYHCKTVGLLRAPESVVNWYKNSDSESAKMIRERYKKISYDFEA